MKNGTEPYEAGIKYMAATDDTWADIKNITEFRQALANANCPATPTYTTDVECDDFERGAWDEFCRRYGER